jgi:Zn-dependent peptidase ImmA (M78 family)/transcriptional regulator with XRE-family HTH domain
VGSRIAEARSAVALTQEALAEAIGLDRTALSKIETGRRQVDSLELARIAEAVGRPLEWFVTLAPQSILSWRAAELAPTEITGVELLLEDLARDVELLHEIGVLEAPPGREPIHIESVAEATAAASSVREELGVSDSPIDLLDVADRLGIYVFILSIADEDVDGAYLALQSGGVAVINGDKEPGRRRFTVAHEIGHFVAQDEFAADWTVRNSSDDRERLMDAFAINLLLPVSAARSEWSDLRGNDTPRDAAITLGIKYRLSWSALCAHLRNIDLIESGTYASIIRTPPTRADFVELGLAILPARPAPIVPRSFGVAAIKAYKKYDITAERTLELLRGSVNENELPIQPVTPLDGLRAEL